MYANFYFRSNLGSKKMLNGKPAGSQVSLRSNKSMNGKNSKFIPHCYGEDQGRGNREFDCELSSQHCNLRA